MATQDGLMFIGRVSLSVTFLLATFLSLGCWTTTAPPKVKEEFFAAYEKDQRPIELTFRMVDQDGQGAKNFRFKVDLSRLHRFLGFIRYTREECHEVTTDEEGRVHISMPGKKASYISFKEVDISRYVFSKSLRYLGEVPMGKFTDGTESNILRVVRHGQVAKLVEFIAPYLEQKAEGINLFSIVPTELRPFGAGALACEIRPMVSSVGAEGLVIVVENLKQAAVAGIRGEKAAGDDSALYSWSVRVLGNGRYMLREGDDDFRSYAPEEGYHDVIEWAIAARAKEKTGLSKCFYAKDSSLNRYYWFNIGVGSGPGDNIHIRLDGCTNPDGSNNLYKDVWPDRRAFEAWSKRCP